MHGELARDCGYRSFDLHGGEKFQTVQGQGENARCCLLAVIAERDGTVPNRAVDPTHPDHAVRSRFLVTQDRSARPTVAAH